MEKIRGNAAARMLALVERIERLDLTAVALGDNCKEVYRETKSEDFMGCHFLQSTAANPRHRDGEK